MIWRIDLTVLSNMIVDIEAKNEEDAIDLFYSDLSDDEVPYIRINTVSLVH